MMKNGQARDIGHFRLRPILPIVILIQHKDAIINIVAKGTDPLNDSSANYRKKE